MDFVEALLIWVASCFPFFIPLIIPVGSYGFYKHAARHTDGTDDIRDATSEQKGLMTAAQAAKLLGIDIDQYLKAIDYQDATPTDFNYESVRMMCGFVKVEYNSAIYLAKTVTFPTAFSTVFGVWTQKTNAGHTITGSSSNWSALGKCFVEPQNVAASNFVAVMCDHNNAPFIAGDYAYFYWFAIGVV